MFRHLTDKRSIPALADKYGVATPKTWAPYPEADIPYPVLFKPAYSAGGYGIRLLLSREDLLRALKEQSAEAVLQEVLEDGDEVTLSMLADRGKVFAVSACKPLLNHPRPFGPAMRSLTIEDDELVAAGIRLLEGLNYHGSANLDFRRSRTTGTPYLLDFNVRLGGTTGIAIASGVDLPFMLYRVGMDLPYEPMPAPQVGLEYSWLFYDELLAYAQSRDWRGALRRLARLHQVETNFAWNDPWPHFYQFYAGSGTESAASSVRTSL